MNKVVLLGRLTFDPEVRYTQSAEPVQVTKYTLAVNRKFKREGEPDADFIPCSVFGKAAEFASKYFKKGMLVCVSGRISIRNYEDQNGQKRTYTDIQVEDQDFAESKASFEARSSSGASYAPAPPSSPKPYTKPAEKAEPAFNTNQAGGFYPIDESLDDEELPF